ncbi:M28 family metallopeptidase [Phenylobacterium sp.]|uniref:M28 family metallopeptidase n=1 Tax=Phenylobacterium sp. TaxID=1871053 RepID=UPI002DE38A10|nr:M28 family peptidase [Phenylobacterium sp.]
MKLFSAALAVAAAAPASLAAGAPPICAACVQADMQRLAGDELRGRKCGTADENAAARFVSAELKRLGVRGAFARGDYLQPVDLLTPAFAQTPTLEISAGGPPIRLEQGRDMLVGAAPPALDAPAVRVTDAQAAAPNVAGELVIYDSPAFDPAGVASLFRSGALAVVSPPNARILAGWAQAVGRPPGPTVVLGADPPPMPSGQVIIIARPEAMAALRAVTAGEARLSAPRAPDQARRTYNVVGVIHGAARDADRHAILLSAHYDHLGVREGVIFHGANDDASGTAAVLEFARILGSGPRPQRTVYFALFGCEEEGGLGAQYFRAHPPGALSDLVANLEFEMIGVNDPKQPGFLMLTGWERSDLGPALKAHGALIAPDPYPQENFFRRSDNYQLALKGVVAQTVSAWPLTPTYHSATDDLDHVDLAFMDQVIGSLVGPVEWLLNSDFQPSWVEGRRP